MKYPYSVKANGKWYRPNEEVPTDHIADTDKMGEPETVSEKEKAATGAENAQVETKKAKKGSGAD